MKKMAWTSMHLFVTLCLCTYTRLQCANAGPFVTPPLPTTDVNEGSAPVNDDLSARLLQRMGEQEARLQRLETTVLENVKALRHKDEQIQALKMRVTDLESKTKLDTSRIRRSLRDPTGADQQSKIVANRLRVNVTASDSMYNASVHHNGNREEESRQSESPVRPQTVQQHTQADGPTEQRKLASRVGPAITHTDVAFSVTLHSDTYLQSHETLVYSNVLLDNSNMFNARTGIFVVPVSGVYVFTWSCSHGHDGGGVVHTSLRIDGVSRCVTFADSPDGGDFGSSTGLIVTSVNQGVSVYVRAESAGKIINNGEALATFSGWRLF